MTLTEDVGTSLAQRRWRQPDDGAGGELVSVVIPCYNQAHFLPDAIQSVLAQTHPHLEVVVVDDGSDDNTAAVAARFPGVRCVRQPNQGLAAARNTGLRESQGSYLVFLDADDRLLPDALAAGLACLRAHPACAFAAGHYRLIGWDGSVVFEAPPQEIDGEPYAALLRRNFIGMHATVLYRRAVFGVVGGFNPSLRACEDYDLYLRIAARYSVCFHKSIVAEYRKYGSNMSASDRLMLKYSLEVLHTQYEHVRNNRLYREAYTDGLQFWRRYYGTGVRQEVLDQLRRGGWREALHGLLLLIRLDPSGTFAWISRQALPWSKRASLEAEAREPGSARGGEVRFGDLRRLTPISRVFGFDRGRPVDRYYIEQFLEQRSEDIHGRVLEIGDDSYTRQYGGSRVQTSDVLHVREGNPKATIVADLTRAENIPSAIFDCVILTQTLHLMYDMSAAVRTLERILRPGGVLLATVPGISQIARDEWGKSWYWSLTMLSARRLIEEAFPPSAVDVEARGNVLASIAFLHGLAADELSREELDYRDPQYQLLIAIRAVKST